MVTQKTQKIKPEEFVNAILQDTNAQAAEVLKAGGKLKTIPGFEDFATTADAAQFLGYSKGYMLASMAKPNNVTRKLYPDDVISVRYYDGYTGDYENGSVNVFSRVKNRDDIKVSYLNSRTVSLCHTGCDSCDQVILSSHSPQYAYSARMVLALAVMRGAAGNPMTKTISNIYKAFLASDYVKAFKADNLCPTCPMDFHKESPVMTKATKMPGLPEEHHAEVLPTGNGGDPVITAVGFAPELIQLIMRTAINESVAAILRHTREG